MSSYRDILTIVIMSTVITNIHSQCYFLESGKVELWDLEAGDNICSTRGDDDAVTCVKVMRFLLDPSGEAMRKYLLISNSYTKLN